MEWTRAMNESSCKKQEDFGIVYVSNAAAGAGNIYVFRLQKPLSKQGHRDTVVLFKRDWSHLFLFNDLMLLGALVTIPMPFNDPGSRVKKRGDQYITFHSLSFHR